MNFNLDENMERWRRVMEEDGEISPIAVRGFLEGYKQGVLDIVRQYLRERANEPEPCLEEVTPEDIERAGIEQALERWQGDRRAAARDLGISERTLYRKLKQYGLA